MDSCESADDLLSLTGDRAEASVSSRNFEVSSFNALPLPSPSDCLSQSPIHKISGLDHHVFLDSSRQFRLSNLSANSLLSAADVSQASLNLNHQKASQALFQKQALFYQPQEPQQKINSNYTQQIKTSLSSSSSIDDDQKSPYKCNTHSMIPLFASNALQSSPLISDTADDQCDNFQSASSSLHEPIPISHMQSPAWNQSQAFQQVQIISHMKHRLHQQHQFEQEALKIRQSEEMLALHQKQQQFMVMSPHTIPQISAPSSNLKQNFVPSSMIMFQCNICRLVGYSEESVRQHALTHFQLSKSQQQQHIQQLQHPVYHNRQNAINPRAENVAFNTIYQTKNVINDTGTDEQFKGHDSLKRQIKQSGILSPLQTSLPTLQIPSNKENEIPTGPLTRRRKGSDEINGNFQTGDERAFFWNQISPESQHWNSSDDTLGQFMHFSGLSDDHILYESEEARKIRRVEE
ncbi:hypothetical protein HK096_002834 [Nowakowskiella sp. JEL0078]|nr:hypothetical protein HK096_002834 [Nowakowskiella sp. JEL0078]